MIAEALQQLRERERDMGQRERERERERERARNQFTFEYYCENASESVSEFNTSNFPPPSVGKILTTVENIVEPCNVSELFWHGYQN